MLFRLFIVIFTLIFAGALEVSVFYDYLFFRVLFFLVFFSVLIVWPITRKLRFLAVPFFLSIGSLSLLYLIDEPAEKHLFVILSSVVYYLAILGSYRLRLYSCDQTAQGMINFATIASAFFWFVSNYGWYLNFQIGIWVLVLTFVASTFLIGWPSLMICEASFLRLELRSQKRKLEKVKNKEEIVFFDKGHVVFFLSMVLSLLMGEVIWALALWPFAYLTTGVVALIVYFVLWDIARLFIRGDLTLKLIGIDVFLAGILVVSILTTTRWDLVV